MNLETTGTACDAPSGIPPARALSILQGGISVGNPSRIVNVSHVHVLPTNYLHFLSYSPSNLATCTFNYICDTFTIPPHPLVREPSTVPCIRAEYTPSAPLSGSALSTVSQYPVPVPSFVFSLPDIIPKARPLRGQTFAGVHQHATTKRELAGTGYNVFPGTHRRGLGCRLLIAC